VTTIVAQTYDPSILHIYVLDEKDHNVQPHLTHNIPEDRL
jgi:hypothetical protein